jgi:hypothetical protein
MAPPHTSKKTTKASASVPVMSPRDEEEKAIEDGSDAVEGSQHAHSGELQTLMASIVADVCRDPQHNQLAEDAVS